MLHADQTPFGAQRLGGGCVANSPAGQCRNAASRLPVSTPAACATTDSAAAGVLRAQRSARCVAASTVLLTPARVLARRRVP